MTVTPSFAGKRMYNTTVGIACVKGFVASDTGREKSFPHYLFGKTWAERIAA